MISKNTKYLNADIIIAALLLLLFVIGVHAFQYRGVLGESDLYRVLDGMLDGAVTGLGLGSDLHYGRDFGFGYILALYALIPAEVLRDPDKLIPLINNLGLYSIILGLFFFWLSICLVHGSRAATVALALFAFSPMVLELATSGHQILIAFFFLSAAAACLFWPVAGWRAVSAAIVGTILLICGLCVRAEIFLALPYLVLTRLNFASWHIFLRSVTARALSPTAALIAYLALKHNIVSTPHGFDVAELFKAILSLVECWACNRLYVPGMRYRHRARCRRGSFGHRPACLVKRKGRYEEHPRATDRPDRTHPSAFPVLGRQPAAVATLFVDARRNLNPNRLGGQ